MEMFLFGKRRCVFVLKSLFLLCSALGVNQLIMAQGNDLRLNQKGYFEKRGLNVMVFSNWYDGNFSDSKISGIEIIHHGVRTVTNGDVRLNSTPGQWDPVPELVSRKTDTTKNQIEAYLRYPKFDFGYVIKTEARDGGIYIGVYLDKALPESLKGKAGLNLEFLPAAYFEKTYFADNNTGNFPLYPSGEMFIDAAGKAEPLPYAQGKSISFAPEDPERKITIRATEGILLMFDGRNQAQNGWFVLRTIIPSERTGKVVEWFVSANTISNWTRPPVIGHSQAGYHPNQEKIAVIELDKNDSFPPIARLLKINENGNYNTVFSAKTVEWGEYLRYKYAKFDFSNERNEGLYMIECGGVRTKPFRISKEAYKEVWHLTQDIFMPVQMDHMYVNEAYRVWHGASHLDDARQAPVNYEHFDLYAQGPGTDSPFKPGEHISGLNIGGWFDAGDFDIRTETHYDLILKLVHAWEQFSPRRDETTINESKRYVNIHVPDGKPDMLQQIEHGTLALIAQYRVFGHAIPGIIAPDLTQ
jgi:endoglucanase